MVSDEPTRKITKRLAAAGFVQTDGKGSHTKWTHTSGVVVIVRLGTAPSRLVWCEQVNKAIEQSEAK